MPGFASEGASFCEECGARLVRACPSCGAPAGSEAKFCRGCGALLQTDVRTPAAFTPSHLAEKILASRAALESERKQVTALFADLRGSMELLEEFDTEEARRLMDPAVQMMMDAVHRYEGTVNHVLGDGIMALFGAPIATRTRRLYTMALQAIDLQEKPDEALRCELLLALGEAQNEAGERDKAEEAFYQAAGIAREMGKAELLARAALGRGGRLLLGEAHLGGDALLVPLIEAALDAVGERDGVPRARLLALLAALIHKTRRNGAHRSVGRVLRWPGGSATPALSPTP